MPVRPAWACWRSGLASTSPISAGILDRLVEAGFVSREEDAGDRRLVVSRLTPKGEATLAHLYDSRAVQVGERLERLSPEHLPRCRPAWRHC